MMEGKRLLRSLTLKNVLSFGPEGMTLDFEPLNVLIGPNGSGKSNLIAALGFLRTLPKELGRWDQNNDTWIFNQWLWKGDEPAGNMGFESEWSYVDDGSIKHAIEVVPNGFRHLVYSELISAEPVYSFKTDLNMIDNTEKRIRESSNDPGYEIQRDQSLLSHFRNIPDFKYFSYVSDCYTSIKIYRDWTFGHNSQLRSSQPSSLRDDVLAEDARNLSLVLKRIQNDPTAAPLLLKNLQQAYEGIEEIRVDVRDDEVSLSIIEEGSISISARRLSDGTLRFLSLLALLCDPSPPPLICLEEPELGLHPDMIPTIAKLLIEASQRTQLIVTTHSADLVSALGEVPEAVVICEKRWGSTTLRRLEAEPMKKWLEEYTLGHLWAMGELGGNRW